MNEFYQHNIITIWVVAFVFEIVMGLLSQTIAEKKGHSKSWFWAGFLLSFVGVVWAAGLPDEKLRRQLKSFGEPAGIGSVPTVPAAPPEGRQDDGELVAVLAAAVAAMGEQQGKQFRMRSFRPVGESSTAWNRNLRGRAHTAYR